MFLILFHTYEAGGSHPPAAMLINSYRELVEIAKLKHNDREARYYLELLHELEAKDKSGEKADKIVSGFKDTVREASMSMRNPTTTSGKSWP